MNRVGVLFSVECLPPASPGCHHEAAWEVEEGIYMSKPLCWPKNYCLKIIFRTFKGIIYSRGKKNLFFRQPLRKWNQIVKRTRMMVENQEKGI